MIEILNMKATKLTVIKGIYTIQFLILLIVIGAGSRIFEKGLKFEHYTIILKGKGVLLFFIQ